MLREFDAAYRPFYLDGRPLPSSPNPAIATATSIRHASGKPLFPGAPQIDELDAQSKGAGT